MLRRKLTNFKITRGKIGRGCVARLIISSGLKHTNNLFNSVSLGGESQN
jgi:hypothetical protein